MWYLSSIPLSIPHHVPHNIAAINLCVFFFFDKALSSVRAGHVCMGMGPSEYGKPTNGHSLWKKKILLPQATINCLSKDGTQRLPTPSVRWFGIGLIMHRSWKGDHSYFEFLISTAVSCPEIRLPQPSSPFFLPPFFFFFQCSLIFGGAEINIDVLFGDKYSS